MNVKLGVALAALVVGLPAVAMAETPGVYFEVGGAVDFPQNSDVHEFNAGAANRISEKAEWDTGFAVDAKIGYAFPPLFGISGFRLEEELGWRYATLNNVRTAVTGTGRASGRKQDYTAMTNLLYDFDLGLPVIPYVGGGVGYDRSNQVISRIGGVAPAPLRVRGYDSEFAYQGIFGVAYALNDNLRLTGEYHYFRTINPTYSTNLGARARSQDADNSIFLGVRYVLGTPVAPPPPPPPPDIQPPPPPPPVQPPVAVRSYQIFFDFDRSVITPQAQQVLQRAAQSAQQQGVTRITLTGHTDTVGSNAYNLALSRRRADATKAALVRLGVPAGAITTIGVGKADLLVPTADGVREPQNRRVEIAFS